MFILQEQKNAYINIYMQIGRNLECLSACAGNIRKVQELCKRSRGSMAAILNLGEAVLEPPDPEEAARDELKRTKAMAGETATIWAIQPTEDPASRQALPSWVSLPLEKGVAKWGEENKKWEVKINRRLNEGKCLTPADQAKYDNFREKRSELKFLFNKETQSHLVKIRSNASLKNLFSLQVNMSSNADDLKVRAGSGAFHKLVMLQGEPIEEDLIPPGLDAGVADGVLQHIRAGQAEDPASDVDEDAAGFAADLQQAEALLNADVDLEAQESQEEEPVEVLMGSSDEELVTNLLTGVSHKRVKMFDHRDAFKRLSARGLTMYPTHIKGAFISHHSTSRTWQAFFPGCHSGLSFTYGGSTKRHWDPCFRHESLFLLFGSVSILSLFPGDSFICMYIYIHYIYIATD